jgi:hypothetical protein
MFSLQLQVLMSVREFEQISFRAQEAAMEDRPTIINVDGTAGGWQFTKRDADGQPCKRKRPSFTSTRNT